jgi:hypothetical protein
MNAEDYLEQDLRSISVHEAGHWVVSALGFGIPATMTIDIGEDDTLTGGWCPREFSGSKFETGCVGWAGVVAEHLLGTVWRYRTPLLFPLTEETLSQWHWEALFYLRELSASDYQHIVGYPHTDESLRHAVRILLRHRAKLEVAAALLAERTRRQIDERWAGIPRPPATVQPWTLAEFTRAMEANGDGAGMFKAFVRSELARSENWRTVQAQIAERGLPEGAQPPSLESWTAARLAAHETQGIADRQSWRVLARSFCTWQVQRPRFDSAVTEAATPAPAPHSDGPGEAVAVAVGPAPTPNKPAARPRRKQKRRKK